MEAELKFADFLENTVVPERNLLGSGMMEW